MSKDNVANVVYQQAVTGLGNFTLRRLSLSGDMQQIYAWVTQSYAEYWGMQAFTLEQVTAEYQRLCKTSEVYIGEREGMAVFLAEIYDPAKDVLAEHYEVTAGDRGMHILVAPADKPISGFTWAAFNVVMQFIFSDKAVKRVVVEPDSRNQKIHALNARAGFEFIKLIELSHKTARLEFCTRQQFFHALTEDKVMSQATRLKTRLTTQTIDEPTGIVAHLNPTIWAKVNRLLIRKALSEFAHEKLIQPLLINTEADCFDYEVQSDRANTVYRFGTQKYALNHWAIDEESIEKRVEGSLQTLDAVAFITEFKKQLGITDILLPTYLEEICSTLYGSAYKHYHPSASAQTLADADFQTFEAAMTEGHPCFIANNGRIGFDARDYHAFAPEVGQPVQLVWLAVVKQHTVFASANDLSYERLIAEEFDESTRTKFAQTLKQYTNNPDEYYYMPAHPWQWNNKLASLFAADIANGDIVCLGYSKDQYQAQQSIRTFFNTSQPGKRYVKVALSILNMGFMRGLSPYYMSNTPAINDWINNLIQQDPYLSTSGFSILREVAGIGYRNPRFEQATDQQSPYRKMFSALWRESPMSQLAEDQHLMTMAGLLHLDTDGNALLPALIKASGVSTESWITAYLHSYLTPLLHCFYAYDLVFMPHGENIILVMQNKVPVRAIMKDIAEECAIMNKDVVLSDEVQRMAVDVPEELKILSIFTDIFDCFFRFLAPILAQQGDYTEKRFWSQVADCVHSYQEKHPELQDKFERYDLFADEFTLSCLNRLQLSNNQQMIDLADPAKNLKFEGTLQNPIATFRKNKGVKQEVGAELS